MTFVTPALNVKNIHLGFAKQETSDRKMLKIEKWSLVDSEYCTNMTSRIRSGLLPPASKTPPQRLLREFQNSPSFAWNFCLSKRFMKLSLQKGFLERKSEAEVPIRGNTLKNVFKFRHGTVPFKVEIGHVDCWYWWRKNWKWSQMVGPFIWWWWSGGLVLLEAGPFVQFVWRSQSCGNESQNKEKQILLKI